VVVAGSHYLDGTKFPASGGECNRIMPCQYGDNSWGTPFLGREVRGGGGKSSNLSMTEGNKIQDRPVSKDSNSSRR
jgi:hypothetical protein